MKISRSAAGAAVFRPNDVTVREPLVEDMIVAERISGKTQGFEFLAALMSQTATFDGVRVPIEDVRRLSSTDFLSIAAELDIADVTALPSELSTSSGKDGSVTPG